MSNPFDYHSLAAMRDIHQFFSVDNYYSYFDCLLVFVLCHFPGICEAYFLSTFIKGLKPEIMIYVLQHHPSNVLDAYELALIQEYSLHCAKKKPNVIVAEQHPNLPGSTVHDGTSLSAIMVIGSTTEQEEVIDSIDGSVEISLPYSVKRLPSATTEAVGSRVQGEVALTFSPGADVTLVVHKVVQCQCIMEVQEAIKDRGVIAVLRPGDHILREYHAPLVVQLDMANGEGNCLNAKVGVPAILHSSATPQNQSSSAHSNILDKGGTLVPVSLGTLYTIVIPLGDRVQKNWLCNHPTPLFSTSAAGPCVANSMVSSGFHTTLE